MYVIIIRYASNINTVRNVVLKGGKGGSFMILAEK